MHQGFMHHQKKAWGRAGLSEGHGSFRMDPFQAPIPLGAPPLQAPIPLQTPMIAINSRCHSQWQVRLVSDQEALATPAIPESQTTWSE